jgi:uncharacterized protein YjbJ (UPF0337 family)
MLMNENVIKGKWLKLRGEVQKAWGKLTDDELDRTKGDMKAIGGLIQQRYGETQEKYGTKLDEIMKRVEQNKDEKIESIKDKIKH